MFNWFKKKLVGKTREEIIKELELELPERIEKLKKMMESAPKYFVRLYFEDNSYVDTEVFEPYYNAWVVEAKIPNIRETYTFSRTYAEDFIFFRNFHIRNKQYNPDFVKATEIIEVK